MLVSGFKEIPLNFGCFGLESVHLNLSLDIVLNKNFTSVEFIDSKEKRNLTKWWVSELTFKTRDNQLKTFTGIIVFPSQDALIQLLISDYVSKDNTTLSRLLEDARINNNNYVVVRQINKFIFDENNFTHISNPVSGRLMTSSLSSCNFELLRQNKLEQININDENYYFLNGSNLSAYFYYVDMKERYGKYLIPRRKYLLYLDNGFQLFWDGNNLNKLDLVAPTIEELSFAVGEEFVKELSSNGKTCAGWIDDPYQREYLEPTVLIKVPPANKINKRTLRSKNNTIPPINLDTVLFVQDTRTAVKLPRNLPVIEDKDSVLYFLSRIRNGAYISDDSPLTPTKFLQDKEYYLVGSKLNSIH